MGGGSPILPPLMGGVLIKGDVLILGVGSTDTESYNIIMPAHGKLGLVLQHVHASPRAPPPTLHVEP